MKIRSLFPCLTHFSVIFYLITAVSTEGFCRNGWKHFTGTCYLWTKRIESASLGETICRNENAELITTQTPDEINFLPTLVSGNIWTSVVRSSHSYWAWDDGTPLTAMTFSLHNINSEEKECAVFVDKKIVSADCNASHEFICKRPRLTDTQCEANWINFHGNCYYYEKTLKKRSEASDFCFKLLSNLTTVHSSMEGSFLNDLTNGSAVFIGLHSTSSPYINWTSKYGKFPYIHWGPSEPSSSQELKNKECVHVTSSGTFSDAVCSKPLHVCCQYRENSCENGWEEIGRSCFKIIHEEVTYKEALTACMEEGSSLASIETYELERVATILPSRIYWVGAQKEKNVWSWIDDRPFNWNVSTFSEIEGSSAYFDRNLKSFYEINQEDSRRFPALCRYNVLVGRKRRCRDITVSSNDVCYREIEDGSMHSYEENKEKKCPVFSSIEDFYWQQPKYIEVDNGKWHYCIYDVKISENFLGKMAEQKEHVNFIQAEKFCRTWMHGRLIYPENREEIEFMHKLFIEPSDGFPRDIGLSLDVKNLHDYNTINYLHQKTSEHRFVVSYLRNGELCSSGWVLVGKSCLRFYKNPKSYGSAKKFCEAMENTYLATFSNREELLDAWYAYEIRLESYWVNITYGSTKSSTENDCPEAYRGEKVKYSKCSKELSFVCEYKSNIEAMKDDTFNRILCKGYYNSSEFDVPPGMIDEGQENEEIATFSCPLHWFQLDDACFRYYPEALSWDDAQKRCEGRGGMLAVFRTAEQYMEVTNQIEKEPFWIGLRKRSSKWQWVNGRSLIYQNFTTINTKYRSCLSGSFVKTREEPLKSWNAQICSRRLPYMCMIKPEGCEVGFDEYLENCYFHFPTEMPLRDAEKICRSKNANIVWIETQEEQEYLNEFAEHGFWIGVDLKYNQSYWVNGKRINYKNWKQNIKKKTWGTYRFGISTQRGWFIKQETDKATVVCKHKKYRKSLLYHVTSGANIDTYDEILEKGIAMQLTKERRSTKKDIWTLIIIITCSLAFFAGFGYCIGLIIYGLKKNSDNDKGVYGYH